MAKKHRGVYFLWNTLYIESYAFTTNDIDYFWDKENGNIEDDPAAITFSPLYHITLPQYSFIGYIVNHTNSDKNGSFVKCCLSFVLYIFFSKILISK